MCLWPGLALMSVQFIPQVQTIWIARLPGAALLIVALVLFAACAIYWAFLTEIIPFPKQLGQAIAVVLTVPIHLVLLTITSQENVWEILVIGFIMESIVIFVPVTFLVFEKMRTDWNTFAIIVLLGTTGVFLSVAAPLVLAIVEQSFWTYVVIVSGVISGSIQTVNHYRYSPRSTLDPVGFIILGVAGCIFLPLLPTIFKVFL